MTPDLDDIRATIALMRETGATRLKSEGLEIELGPAPQPPAPEPRPEKPETESLCACGCPTSLHGGAGCLNVCSIERCLTSPQRPAPEEGGP